MSQPPGVPGSTEPPPEETAVPADSAGSATGSARSDPGSAGPVAVPHQEAHVGGGGSVYQAGRDQVFRYEDGVHGLSRAEPGSPSAECPYPGLAAFGPDLARWFFGRDQAVAQLSEELAGRLDRGGALMVIGPSGAGKSSLLQAGLIPALDRGVLPAAGSSDWPHDVFTPTASPLAELAACLERLTGVSVERHSAGAAQAAEEDVAAIRRVVEQDRAGRTPDTRVILIMDQFEEVFALCPHEQERQAFISLLAELAAPSPGGASAAALVVLGMRADFYAQAAQYPQLREVMRDGLVLLDPLSRSELRQAIIYPARDVGLDIEPGLVEILLRDLGVNDRADGPAAAQATPGDGAGRLPLLAHALRVTWQQRQGHQLTVEG